MGISRREGRFLGVPWASGSLPVPSAPGRASSALGARLFAKAPLTILLAAMPAPVSAVDLELELTAGGTAPLTEVLRRAEAGAGLGLQFTWGATRYLDIGARYGVGIFPQQAVDAAGNEQDPILDHSASAVLRLAIVGGDAGWLGRTGTMDGELWLDVGLGYHMIGQESCFGFDAALGYRFDVTDGLALGPLFRTNAVFGTSEGTASWVTFGLTIGYDFGTLLRAEPAPPAEPVYEP